MPYAYDTDMHSHPRSPRSHRYQNKLENATGYTVSVNNGPATKLVGPDYSFNYEVRAQ